MSSKSILIILHYTVSKFAYCFETQCTGMCVCAMCRTRTLTCWYRGHGRAVQISHHHRHRHSFTVNCDSRDQLGFSRNFHNEVISLHTSALDSGTRQPGNLPGGQTWYFDPPDFLERNIFWCTGQSILSKIIKIVATSCQILTLKCTKFDFGWGPAPDAAGGTYSAPPDPSWI